MSDKKVIWTIDARARSVGSIGSLIIDNFPEKKMELRGKLLEILIKTDSELSQRIEKEFNRFY